MKVTLKYKRETPGALVFEEVGSPSDQPIPQNQAEIGTLYIRKTSSVGQQRPSRILVEVTNIS